MAAATTPQGNAPATLLSSAFVAMRRAFFFAFIFSFTVNALSLLMPLYSMQVFDRVFTSRSYETLIGLTVIVAVGYLFYGALYAVRAGVIARVVEWLERTVAPQLLNISIIQAAQSGLPMAGQHQRDLMTIKNFVSSGAPTLMDIPWALLFVLVIYLINPVLGFISVLGIVLLSLSALVNEYATRKALMRATEKNVESSLNADMIGRHAEAIQAMGMGPDVIARWVKQNEVGLALQDIAQQRSAIIMGFSRACRMALQMAIIGIGAVLALHNELSSGGLIACSIMTARALAPFEGTIMLWKQFVQARDAYHRLHFLLTHVDMRSGDTTLPQPMGRLTVEGLYYAPSKTVTILRGISLSLEPGESLGIIGPSAAGKSTLAKAMVGIFPPTHGTVRLDGADVYRWARQDFGQYVGYLPQQVELFMGTIKQNIARMQEHFSDEAVIQAAQLAGVHDMILQLPGAYDTPYVPGNTVLSPGQKQRIGLARALFGNPRVVVLDEPNSNLDGEGERALMLALEYLRNAAVTLVIVAHRPSVMASVDKILMLRGGMVEVIGPRDEVMQRFTPGGSGKRLQPNQGGRP